MTRESDNLKEIGTGFGAASDEQFAAVSDWVRMLQEKVGLPNVQTSAIVRVDDRRFLFATPHELRMEEYQGLIDAWNDAMPGYSLFVLHSTVYIPMEVAHGDQGPDHGQVEGRPGVPDGGDEAGRGGDSDAPVTVAGGDAEGYGPGAVVEREEGPDPGAGGSGERGGSDPDGARPPARAKGRRRAQAPAPEEA